MQGSRIPTYHLSLGAHNNRGFSEELPSVEST